MANAALQFNSYMRMPRDLFGKFDKTGRRIERRKFSIYSVFTASLMSNFTIVQEDGSVIPCKRTYKKLSENFGYSEATAGRSLRALKAEGYISNAAVQSTYLFDNSKAGTERYYRLENWVHFYKLKKSKRRTCLTPAEKLVYAYIFTFADNSKRSDKYVECSINDICTALDLVENTVSDAVKTLLREEMIYRPIKGKNGHRKSVFRLNRRLLREQRKEAAKSSKKAAKTNLELVADTSKPDLKPSTSSMEGKAEFERHYSEVRHLSETIAENNLKRAREDSRFKIADDELRQLSIDIAFAEVKEPWKVRELEERQTELKRNRQAAMRRLGFKEKDFEVQCKCGICKDTGYAPGGGFCICWTRGAPVKR